MDHPTSSPVDGRAHFRFGHACRAVRDIEASRDIRERLADEKPAASGRLARRDHFHVVIRQDVSIQHVEIALLLDEVISVTVGLKRRRAGQDDALRFLCVNDRADGEDAEQE